MGLKKWGNERYMSTSRSDYLADSIEDIYLQVWSKESVRVRQMLDRVRQVLDRHTKYWI